MVFENAKDSTQRNKIDKKAAAEAFKDKAFVNYIGVSLLKSTSIINMLNTSVTTVETAMTQQYMDDKCKENISTRRRDEMKTVADGEVKLLTRM